MSKAIKDAKIKEIAGNTASEIVQDIQDNYAIYLSLGAWGIIRSNVINAIGEGLKFNSKVEGEKR